MNDNAAKAERNATSDVAVGESEKKVQDLQYQVQDLTSEKVISIYIVGGRYIYQNIFIYLLKFGSKAS